MTPIRLTQEQQFDLDLAIATRCWDGIDATVHRAEKAGKISGYKLGYKTTRYALDDIEAWLSASKTTATVN